MKIKFEKNELWPVYLLDEKGFDHSFELELTDEQIKDYLEGMNGFNHAQHLIQFLIEQNTQGNKNV